MSVDRTIGIYEANAEILGARYNRVETDKVFAPMLDLLPAPPAHVLDVGAGSGRDADWFAARGHLVTAAEPVAAFRDAIRARLPQAHVIDARLPGLEQVTGRFGLILANAVWHHLAPATRDVALARLADLTAPSGRLIISLRHGRLPEGQPIFEMVPQDEIARAAACGLDVLRAVAAPSHQQENTDSGITWTWLAFHGRNE